MQLQFIVGIGANRVYNSSRESLSPMWLCDPVAKLRAMGRHVEQTDAADQRSSICHPDGPVAIVVGSHRASIGFRDPFIRIVLQIRKWHVHHELAKRFRFVEGMK